MSAFYRSSTRSVLAGFISVRYGCCREIHQWSIHKTIRVAERIIGVSPPPSTDVISRDRCLKRARRINEKDAPSIFQLLPSGYGLLACLLIICSIIFILATFPISIWFCIKVVRVYERAVLFRFGRLVCGRAKGPGIFLFMPCTDFFHLVDLRTISFSVPPQAVLSKDSVAVMVDAVVYYRIFDPVKSVIRVNNVLNVTHLLAQTTLRNVLGRRNLSDIISEREDMAQEMEKTLLEASKEWGIKVERVEFKDVVLPVGLQRMMAAEAEAVREAKAKVIAAEGERKASYTLKEAATVIMMNPIALQLRYLQSLAEVATEHESTIFFPIPIDLMASC